MTTTMCAIDRHIDRRRRHDRLEDVFAWAYEAGDVAVCRWILDQDDVPIDIGEVLVRCWNDDDFDRVSIRPALSTSIVRRAPFMLPGRATTWRHSLLVMLVETAGDPACLARVPFHPELFMYLLLVSIECGWFILFHALLKRGTIESFRATHPSTFHDEFFPAFFYAVAEVTFSRIYDYVEVRYRAGMITFLASLNAAIQSVRQRTDGDVSPAYWDSLSDETTAVMQDVRRLFRRRRRRPSVAS